MNDCLYEAHNRIHPFIIKTPLTYDPEQELYIKWENKQITGSFKARGAFNKILSLKPQVREKGIVAASAGNHGQGVALAGKLTGTSVTIFMPKHTPEIKIKAIQDLGADFRLISGGYAAAENQGRRYAVDSGATWISPYNDELVIAGQGTVALEILDELSLPGDRNWIVPASGGGLISGIAIALEASTARNHLIAVQSDTSPFMHAIYHIGTQEGIEELPTIAEGLAGAVENESVTISIIKSRVDEFLLVSEEDIKQAISFCWYKYKERIEGAAAVSLAAVLSGQVLTRPAIIIMSGGNIQPELHQQIISSHRIDSRIL